MRAIGAVVLAAVLFGGLALGQEKYVVLSDIAWAPFEWVSQKGFYLGFDLDVMRAIAVLEGYEIEIRDTPFDSIIPAISAGKGDIGASGFTITEERAQVISFSVAYWEANQAAVVRAGSGLTLEQLGAKGRKVGAQRGTTGAFWVEDNWVPKGVTLVEYETYPEAILDLLAGRIEAVVADVDPSKMAVAQYKGKLELAGVIETGERYGFVVRKGDPKGLLPRIERGIAKLKASGAWDLLIQAYFGPALGKIEAAWEKCIPILLVEKDPLRYAQCLVAEVNK
ncbi:MAG: basic amino acid ABC transporter substrate-binding protein [Candidatus Bipolaricaulota bacterium]|nr:basic amino acid ABC transporter substrate-binding protein [Candidatus Bipolaricaulota bacterium]